MSTWRQINTNRENAKHSTGPVTEAGKAASSQNARKHGLTGKQVVVPGENAAEYDDMPNGLRESMGPKTEAEHQLVDLMAANNWRILRGQRIEAALIKKYTDGSKDPESAMAIAYIEKAAEFNRLHRYIAQLERSYFRALREFQKLQREREENEQKEAMIRAYKEQVAERNGFVSSNTAEPEFHTPEQSVVTPETTAQASQAAA